MVFFIIWCRVNNTAQTEAVSFIGKQITTAGNLAILNNGEANWSYRADEAGTASISIFDENGVLVKSENIPIEAGQHGYQWNGITDSGNSAGDGRYAIQITALNENEQSINVTTEFTGIVDGVVYGGFAAAIKPFPVCQVRRALQAVALAIDAMTSGTLLLIEISYAIRQGDICILTG